MKTNYDGEYPNQKLEEPLTFEQIVGSYMKQFAQEYYIHRKFEDSPEMMRIVLEHKISSIKNMLFNIGYHKE
jgi:hypothetical protein